MSVTTLDVLYREAKKLESVRCRRIEAKLERWKEISFLGLVFAASGTKGAAGKALVATPCRNHKFFVERGDKKNDSRITRPKSILDDFADILRKKIKSCGGKNG